MPDVILAENLLFLLNSVFITNSQKYMKQKLKLKIVFNYNETTTIGQPKKAMRE